MLRLIKPGEKRKLLDFYKTNPELNMYLEYLTRTYGLESNNVGHYGYFIKRKLCAVFVSMAKVIVFASGVISEPEEIAQFINFVGRQSEISGPPELIDALSPLLYEEYKRMDTTVCILRHPENLFYNLSSELEFQKNKTEDKTCEIRSITISDIHDVYKILDASRTEGFLIPSLGDYVKSVKSKLENKLARTYILKYQDMIVSTASTNAETDEYAMIGAVATLPSMRGRGFASRVVSRLSFDLLLENKVPLLAYVSDDAKRIYEKLGFVSIGRYSYLNGGS